MASENGSYRRGLILGVVSAIGYSAANLALRDLSGRHDDLGWAIWVSALKALPTAVLALGLLFRRRFILQQPCFPTRRAIPALLLAALVMQFGGNLGFQLSLGYIGLAITVPLVFAFIIGSGAVLGRTFLGDPLTPRTVVSMAVMTVSIILLSYAATISATTENGPLPVTTQSTTSAALTGIAVAVISGLAYGVNGVVIRRVSQRSLPIESMMIIYSTTGIVWFGFIGAYMLGSERLLQVPAQDWGMMLAAGTFNALAFYCIMHALKVMNITQVNVINASQNAMCAVGAVLIFAEPVSVPLVLGIGLSMVGLFVLDRR
ncbi:MAG: DMT family transporter [Planctomycetaceae bacterium]